MLATLTAAGNSMAATRVHHTSTAKAAGDLIIPTVSQFSGANAAFGYTNQGGAQSAIDLINQAGGVLGHQLQSVAVDTLGDPADASLAMARTLAQYGSAIPFVMGAGTTSSGAVEPLVTQANIVNATASGSTSFDLAKSPYFYRLFSPDPEQGVAKTYEAHIRNFNRIALVYGNTSDAQTEIPGDVAAAKYYHMKIVNDTALVLQQTAYQSEVQKIIASKPQAIVTELDPATAATFWGEYKTLSKSHIPMMISDPVSYEVGWLSSMQKILGTAYLKKNLLIVGPFAGSSGPAFRVWASGVNGLPARFDAYKATITINGLKQSDYDFVTIASLAMLEAHSTKPTVFNKFIVKVVAKGGRVVHSFAEGKTLLAHHKKITYVGVTGEVVFNRYHNSPSGFVVHRWSPNVSSQNGGTPISKSAYSKVIIPA